MSQLLCSTNKKFKNSKKSSKWTVIDPDPNDLATKMSSQESVTTQLSIPGTPREESILEAYFELLSQSNFDKAKELVDSEKGGHKFSYAATWGETLQCLSQLASAEKSYHSLVFLSHKRFTNIVKSKDGAKSIYALLHQEFLRMENMSPALAQAPPRDRQDPISSQDDVDTWLSHISGQLSFFVRGRIKMIELYPFKFQLLLKPCDLDSDFKSIKRGVRQGLCNVPWSF
ncbi:upf0536 protein [Plakobranchus ocellatus]|uniref:Upf0536 protein n=1 Tax=Plakobranchus ocellatus TaxID=259542 RepID=A0AAV4CN37_9GAST|nr:upf0536 protein [Plakobranchus ocellatus]